MNTRASFDGLGFNQSGGFVPPDTIAAVGQKYVIETINTTIRISNKNGGVILEEPLSTFFPQSRYGLYDPSVFYDDNSGRFVVEAMENQFDVFGQPTSTSYINIAFSDPGNEGSFTSKYRITTTEGNSWADYPRFGFNADAIVYEFNMFDASTGESDQRPDPVDRQDARSGNRSSRPSGSTRVPTSPTRPPPCTTPRMAARSTSSSRQRHRI